MKRFTITISLYTIIIILLTHYAFAQEDWRKWDNFPKVPKITAKEVKQLMASGEKIVFIYAGYETDKIVCGSYYIPHTKVPPYSNGSDIVINIPKENWIMVY